MLRQKKGLLTTVFEEKHSCVGNDLLID